MHQLQGKEKKKEMHVTIPAIQELYFQYACITDPTIRWSILHYTVNIIHVPPFNLLVSPIQLCVSHCTYKFV